MQIFVFECSKSLSLFGTQIQSVEPTFTKLYMAFSINQSPKTFDQEDGILTLRSPLTLAYLHMQPPHKLLLQIALRKDMIYFLTPRNAGFFV